VRWPRPVLETGQACLDILGMRATMNAFTPTSANSHFQECTNEDGNA